MKIVGRGKMIRNQAPAFMPLACDVSFGRLALGVQGVEILLKPLLC